MVSNRVLFSFCIILSLSFFPSTHQSCEFSNPIFLISAYSKMWLQLKDLNTHYNSFISHKSLRVILTKEQITPVTKFNNHIF